MSSLFWRIIGKGKINLVLLHGWGFNAAIWSCIIMQLSNNFRLHLVDLPGYGRSQGYGLLTLEEITDEIILHAPDHALWLGWSLGGLVATQVAKQKPYAVRGLITVTSSPYFCMDYHWPGIQTKILYNLAKQLCENYATTINDFIDIQVSKTEFSKTDIIFLKKKYLNNLYLLKKF